MTWQEFYKFPLMLDEFDGQVAAQPGKVGYRMAWNWIGNSYICEYPVSGERGDQLADAIIRYINGQSPYRPAFNWSEDPDDPIVILMNDEPCILIRGWGELTGIGALHLPAKDAEKIQDGFRDFLVKKLNGEID